MEPEHSYATQQETPIEQKPRRSRRKAAEVATDPNDVFGQAAQQRQTLPEAMQEQHGEHVARQHGFQAGHHETQPRSQPSSPARSGRRPRTRSASRATRRARTASSC